MERQQRPRPQRLLQQQQQQLLVGSQLLRQQFLFGQQLLRQQFLFGQQLQRSLAQQWLVARLELLLGRLTRRFQRQQPQQRWQP